MHVEKDQPERIRSLLKFHPRGLTISEISQRLKINRNSVSKYLEILQISGNVEMRALGAAKVYYLSQRIPLAAILGFTKEGILVLNADGKIIQVNERFCAMFNLNQHEILSSRISDLPSIFNQILSCQNVNDSDENRSEQTKIIRIEQYDWTQYFKVRTLNTIFDTGDHGRTIIIEDITIEKEMEERLHLNEARYRGIVEDQSEMICRFTAKGRITFANEAFCRTISLPQTKVGSARIFDILSGDSTKNLMDNIRNAQPDSPVWDMEHEITLQDGDTKWHHWIYRGIFDESGKPVEFQGVGHDISEKKKADIELLIKSCAIESSLMPIGLASLDGTINYVNPAFLRMWKYNHPHEIVGLPIEHFAHGNLETLTDIFRIKKEFVEGNGFSGDIKGTTRDGEEIFFHLLISLVRNDSGTPLCYIGYFNDITEKVMLGREMQIRDTAITSSYEGMMIVGKDDRITFVNPSFKRVFRRMEEVETGHSSLIDFLEKYPQVGSQYERIKQDLVHRGNWTGIITDLYGSGNPVIIQLHISSVTDHDQDVLCTIISAIDITEQRMMEESLNLTYRHLEQAIEHMGDPTFIVGNDGRIVAWNMAMTSLTGMNSDEMIGTRRYREAFLKMNSDLPLLADLVNLPVKDLITGYPQISHVGDGLFTEAHIPSMHNGTGALIWAKASPVHDRNGKTIGVIQTFKDMTNWKRAAEITERTVIN